MSSEIVIRKSVRMRGPTTSPATWPMDRPRWRALITRVEKSCTAPMKSVPSETQTSAGSQPQITAMAGPTMGAAPAMEAK